MAAIPPNRTSFCFIDEDDAYVSYVNKLTRYSEISLRRSVSGYAISPTKHYDVIFGQPHHHHRKLHFLDSCFFCSKSLDVDSDVFMYRGDTPFCSEDCRSEQIEMDEMKERRSMISGRPIASKSNKSDRLSCRTTGGTMVTA